MPNHSCTDRRFITNYFITINLKKYSLIQNKNYQILVNQNIHF